MRSQHIQPAAYMRIRRALEFNHSISNRCQMWSAWVCDLPLRFSISKKGHPLRPILLFICIIFCQPHERRKSSKWEKKVAWCACVYFASANTGLLVRYNRRVKLTRSNSARVPTSFTATISHCTLNWDWTILKRVAREKWLLNPSRRQHWNSVRRNS